MSTPAERYAQSRSDRNYPHLAQFRDLYSFGLDEFQIAACQALEVGHGVLVAAPTGSGKTIVGEFGVHLALATGTKCFYTTPIKALSNQKFNDLVVRYGAEHVGLLTGDNSINSEASVVVMTTEVLRNMLYAGSSTLNGLGYVVMDEVHYLADRFRGAVWEEVIIGLPESVSIISLSATVSNAEEFGDWLTEVRGDTVTIVEERRPTPLYQHVMVGRRLVPLFDRDGKNVNRELEKLARDDWAENRFARQRSKKRNVRPRTRQRPIDRVDIVTTLDFEGLLPAIVFIFSRAGCAAAVQQCLDARLNLTTAEESEQIAEFVQQACSHLPTEDLEVLGYPEFVAGLRRGLAAHHAGMLPTFKEVVEVLFSRGLVKVVFATETLALGINMPARSVVIERLTKWNGDTHVEITSGEYTQLTGRAGRRGIDIEGHGVVLWQAGFDPKHVAGLANNRTYPLRSSFQPSYNMAVNMVHQVGRLRARDLLEQSFAQFQADRAVVTLARRVKKAEDAIAGYEESAQCSRGDFAEYMQIRREISDIESAGSKARKRARRVEVIDSLGELRVGDIITVPAGRWAGVAVVLDPGTGGDPEDPRPYVLTTERHARRLALIDFPTPVMAQGNMRIPKSFNSRNPQSRRDLASTLRQRSERLGPARKQTQGPQAVSEDPRLEELRGQLRAHPCHDCPDRESHARWAERQHKLERETIKERRQVEQRTNTVARQFDRVCQVLDTLGYLDGDEVTEQGLRLQRIYSELDLLVSEAINQHIFDDLTAAELSAVVSSMTYESRSLDDAPPPRFPTAGVAQSAEAMNRLASELMAIEFDNRVRFLHRPDFGFADAVWNWCEGASLDEVLTHTDMAAGDFVRQMKQLIDLVAQVGSASGSDDVRKTSREALDLLRRGVVSYSSISG